MTKKVWSCFVLPPEFAKKELADFAMGRRMPITAVYRIEIGLTPSDNRL
jgi:hypothetical protein